MFIYIAGNCIHYNLSVFPTFGLLDDQLLASIFSRSGGVLVEHCLVGTSLSSEN
ncbi:hypothetical protein DICPUDRAFT_147266 [Dictyostelium purpureum]|uniref:Uncharacterized protein n=1 Tax=Dictyostelium purpureum TaxID=5786 RepID=F0Z827_DICPU|nr:uncharacterized protein DICPUDRAFT_147266 [Dictyostelium purpureum]EGC39917.1 hypothetical protein DICPUDRAFT_147266 [Dictyostelium purpureum]|eukprot:XP_003283546.1 hypothetical protein DICPUDRAFT_147266 [Dictyostelium purpureum]